MAAFDCPRAGRDGVIRRLVPIKWGQRAYLIFEEQMIEFCNDVNDGTEPRKDEWNWNAPLRVDDWKKPAGGLPPVPAPWDAMILKAPIHGQITKIVDVPAADQAAAKRAGRFVAHKQAIIDLGQNDHVFIGMRLWGGDSMKVVAVNKTDCVARLDRSELDPVVATKVSSLKPAAP